VRLDGPDEEAMRDRGFTLIEVLVACLLLALVTAAVAAIAAPARNALDRTLGAADMAAGSRATVERLSFDLREAGGGAAVADAGVDLSDVVPFVVPHADLDNPVATTPGQAITLMRLNLGAPQGTLLSDVIAGTASLQLDTTRRCANVGVACGLQPGMTAVIFDASRATMTSIHAVAPGGFVELSAGLTASFGAGAIIAAPTIVTYGLRLNADGSRRLVRSSPGGAEQPVLQNVVAFDVQAYGTPMPPLPPALDGSPATYGPRPPPAGQNDPRDAWAEGENCTIARNSDGIAMPRLASLPSTGGLAAITTAMLLDGPWCPDGADPARFDADLLRIRGVDFRLRVEAASAALRGPVPQLFQRPGTEQNAGRWVPDVEIRTRIALRNVE
jgi:prepilin-type N-terminal cleavage/methylation domain-containing protein